MMACLDVGAKLTDTRLVVINRLLIDDHVWRVVLGETILRREVVHGMRHLHCQILDHNLGDHLVGHAVISDTEPLFQDLIISFGLGDMISRICIVY